MTTLVTGATGFIGSHVARLLAGRGEELRLAFEPGAASAHVDDVVGARIVCDVRDRRAVRRALDGVERVYHCAGITSVRPADAARLFEVNVGGTRTVLEECLRAGVERVVHLSSAAALGPAKPGGAADERQRFDAGGLGIPYVASVYEAEAEALRLHARGLPVVCVNPAMTFGPGDVNLTSTRLVRSFLLGRIAAYAEGAVCVVDVRDVAAGMAAAGDSASRASATSSAGATSPSSACSPTSGACPATSRRCGFRRAWRAWPRCCWRPAAAAGR